MTDQNLQPSPGLSQNKNPLNLLALKAMNKISQEPLRGDVQYGLQLMSHWLETGHVPAPLAQHRSSLADWLETHSQQRSKQNQILGIILESQGRVQQGGKELSAEMEGSSPEELAYQLTHNLWMYLQEIDPEFRTEDSQLTRR
jgi:hypothetical protein